MSKKLKVFLMATLLAVYSAIMAVSSYAEELYIEIQSDLSSFSEAQQAANCLYNSFPKDEFGQIDYPDDFAGTFMNNGKLTVFHTSQNIEKYNYLLSAFSCVEYSQVTYSIKELQQIYKEYIKENECFYYSAYIDEKNNLAVIETDSKTYNKLSSKTKEQYPISLLIGSQIDLNSTLYGGMPLSVDKYGYTIGAVATDSYGDKYIISAGHDMQVNSVAYSNGQRIGVVFKSQYGNEKYGDYSLIKLDDGVNISNFSQIFSDGKRIELTGGYYASPGDYVHKYGKNGGYGSGEVVAVNCEFYITEDKITILGLTKVTIEIGDFTDGDSGGPIYASMTNVNNQPISGKLAGIYCGKSHSGTYFYFTPMMRITGCLPYYS